MVLRDALSQVAWAAARTRGSYYRALYYRMKRHGGSKKAIVAVQYAILVAIWHMFTSRPAPPTRISDPTTSSAATKSGASAITSTSFAGWASSSRSGKPRRSPAEGPRPVRLAKSCRGDDSALRSPNPRSGIVPPPSFTERQGIV